MANPEDEYLKTCSDWFSFHLSHVEDLGLSSAESLWPECEKCRAVYEGLTYTSHEGKFGLMTREVLENLIKRQRVNPKLVSSRVRRGNVPQYVSFISPMPVHLRPGSEESSRFGSREISIVREDLLISAGTQEEGVDLGLETGFEVEIKDRKLGLGEADGANRENDVANQEALVSPLYKSSSSPYGDSRLDAEGSFVELVGSNSQSQNDGDMVNGEHRVGKDGNEGDKKNPSETRGTDFNFDEMCQDFISGLANSSDDDFDHLDSNFETEVGDFNERDGDNNDSDGNRGTYDDIGDASDLDGANNDADLLGDQDLTNTENVADNNLQVTFAEPLATDRRSSTNVADNDDGENRGELRSILKGNDDDDAENKIYNELDVEPSVMKRKISPSAKSKTISLKPVISRREADLGSQSRPSIDITDETARVMKKELDDFDDKEQEAYDDDNSSNDEYMSDHGSYRNRPPKPKNRLYAKRANLKVHSEKLHKRKTSESEPKQDVGISAESSLLRQQILDEEKRLKDGMKPWLKGRLGLSQQNSRFEIPMDLRLLESMTPLDYLANYCVISKRRKALYKHVFQNVDRNRAGSVNYAQLEKGLKDVHTGVLDSGHIENITQMVHVDKESTFDLKQFSAVAAFSERISCKYQLPVEFLNNLDGQKETIECADFFALSWKLDGIRVNPDVKKILDSL